MRRRSSSPILAVISLRVGFFLLRLRVGKLTKRQKTLAVPTPHSGHHLLQQPVDEMNHDAGVYLGLLVQ